jgi:hypothetical protein
MTNHYLFLIVQFVGLNAMYVHYALQCIIYLSLYAVSLHFHPLQQFQYVEETVKFTLEQATKAQMGSRSIALLFP